MQKAVEAFRLYADRRMVAILAMGFSSGLPLALTGATLAIWLKQDGISLTAIGLFAQVGLAYNLKFLWAPVMDRVPVPGLSAWLGRRRGWAVTIQVLLALSILALARTDPAVDARITAVIGVLVAFFSASQDIVIDAFRVELLTDHEQGAGAAATQIGYRIGMLAAGAGALYLASAFDWHVAYTVMACLVGIGMVAVLFTRESVAPRPARQNWFRAAVVEPFADFMTRRDWQVILLFVVLYKTGDAVAGWMSGPFYISIGFSTVEIASISKVFGLIASMAGVVLGGWLVLRVGIMRALLIGGIVQTLSNFAYIVQLGAGHNVAMLAVTIATENVTGGVGSAAFVAYLSRLCNPAFTATQYALLSALAAVSRTFIASGGGWFADRLGWAPFFTATVVLCVPGLLLLLYLMRRDAPPNRSAAILPGGD
jgi:MFS transporter, PAT family, beta-lactamase induction signal transducer AmpG